jgi:pimeloyl-ACP methyl ester carboxylesterase
LPIYIQCADNVNRTASFADAERLRVRSLAVAPDVRKTAFGIASLCVNPPRPATNPQRPLHADGAPPIMVMNSRYDASTPHEGARRVVEQLDRAVLVTYDGMGHGAANRGDCTRNLLYRYLTERRLPAPDTHCPAAAS